MEDASDLVLESQALAARGPRGFLRDRLDALLHAVQGAVYGSMALTEVPAGNRASDSRPSGRIMP